MDAALFLCFCAFLGLAGAVFEAVVIRGPP